MVAFMSHEYLDYGSYFPFYIHYDFERIIIIDKIGSNLRLEQRV